MDPCRSFGKSVWSNELNYYTNAEFGEKNLIGRIEKASKELVRGTENKHIIITERVVIYDGLMVVFLPVITKNTGYLGYSEHSSVNIK